MIEWAFEIGQDELIKMHKEYNYDMEQNDINKKSFNEFVEYYYNESKAEWEDEIINTTKLYFVPYRTDENVDVVNEDVDIDLESAKLVLVQIINDAIKDGKVSDIILENEIAPDYRCVNHIVHSFIYKVIPAVTKMLEKLD